MSSEELSRGHRKRLRERFLKSGFEGFHDYEIVELLLSLGTPRRDCKPAAKAALKRFKTLRGVLEASVEELQEIEGIGPHSAFGIKLIREAGSEFLKAKLLAKPFYNAPREIFDYLYHSMRGLKKEVFKVIHLNAQHQIIDTVDLFEGTVNSSSVSIREVMEDAIKHQAVFLIFAHNHPSGNPQPGSSDREMTRDLVYTGQVMRIKILDHIIIGENQYFSFADAGLIEEYETDFLNLKLRGTAETKRRLYQAKLASRKPE